MDCVFIYYNETSLAVALYDLNLLTVSRTYLFTYSAHVAN